MLYAWSNRGSAWVLLILKSSFICNIESTHTIVKCEDSEKCLNDDYDFTDYVEESDLSFQAGPRNLDLRCPKALWKMCVKSSSEPLGIFKMDERKPCIVRLCFDPRLHSFRDHFLSFFTTPSVLTCMNFKMLIPDLSLEMWRVFTGAFSTGM